MKKIVFAIVCMALPLWIFAQAEVQLGKPYRVVDAPSKLYYLIDNSVITIKLQPDAIVVSKLNATSLAHELTVENDRLPKGFSFENLIELKNTIYLFYSVWDRKNEVEQLFYQTIDAKTCKLSGVEKLVLKVNSRLTGSPLGYISFFAVGVQDKFDFYNSYDKSKLLITYRIKPEIKSDAKNYDIIGLNVFDDELKPLSLNEVKMPHTEKLMNNIDYAVDTEGNAYILTLVFSDRPVIKNEKVKYFIELLKIVPNSKKIVTIPVLLKGKFISKLWLYEFDKNQMVCAGFYCDKENSSNVNGVMLFNINKDNSISKMINHEIPLEILNQFASKRKQNKNAKKDKDDKAEFEDLALKKVVAQADGSIVMVGEQQYSITTTSYSQSGGSSTTTTYYYNDMLACKINTDGSLAWMRKLPKRQWGKLAPGELSFNYMQGNQEHFFMYIDDEENLKLQIDEFPTPHRDGREGMLTAYQVDDKTGSVKKIGVLNTKDVQGVALYQISMDRILPTGDKEFVFEAYKKGKQDILIKVKFK